MSGSPGGAQRRPGDPLGRSRRRLVLVADGPRELFPASAQSCTRSRSRSERAWLVSQRAEIKRPPEARGSARPGARYV